MSKERRVILQTREDGESVPNALLTRKFNRNADDYHSKDEKTKLRKVIAIENVSQYLLHMVFVC